MKIISRTSFFVLALLSFYALMVHTIKTCSAQSYQGHELHILYSANQNGEIGPCG